MTSIHSSHNLMVLKTIAAMRQAFSESYSKNNMICLQLCWVQLLRCFNRCVFRPPCGFVKFVLLSLESEKPLGYSSPCLEVRSQALNVSSEQRKYVKF